MTRRFLLRWLGFAPLSAWFSGCSQTEQAYPEYDLSDCEVGGWWSDGRFHWSKHIPQKQ